MSNYHDDSDRLALPNPMDPGSGYRSPAPGYAIGHSATEAPPNTVWLDELGTYVDEGVAQSMFQHGPDRTSSDEAVAERPAADGGVPSDELSDEDLVSLQDQLEDAKASEERAAAETPSETVRFLGEQLGTERVDLVSEFIAGADPSLPNDGLLSAVSQQTGLDSPAVASLMESAVNDIAPSAQDAIGDAAWSSIVYAASNTPDPLARKIVTDVVRGRVPLSNLQKAYALWYASLPNETE